MSPDPLLTGVRTHTDCQVIDGCGHGCRAAPEGRPAPPGRAFSPRGDAAEPPTGDDR
ncbi:hypothetical protein SSCG_04739 [Streptomyces clavuligerus]|nr:hypothetical protein SSCG_04739 [Streptomyces clavuligerus]